MFYVLCSLPPVITSPKNPTLKQLRLLMTSRKDRRHERLFVIEGVRLAEEAVRSGARLAFGVYNPEQLAGTERGARLLQQIEALPGLVAAPAEIIAGISDTVTSQG